MGSLVTDKRTGILQASFKVWDGRDWKWVRKSTGTSDEVEANAILESYEKAAQLAGPNVAKLDRAAAFRIVEDIVSSAGPLSVSWDQYSQSWLEVRGQRVKRSSLRSYSTHVNNFTRYLGEKSDVKMALIDLDDAQGYYDELIESGMASKSANANIKTVASIFNKALSENYILRNPWEGVERRYGDSNEREPFSVSDIQKLLKACDNGRRTPDHARDWRTMILLALCTGARAGDCKAMTWDNVKRIGSVDVISFTPEKKQRKGSSKNRDVVIPMLPPLIERLEGLDYKSGPLCPSLHATPVSGRHGISEQFRHLVDQSGIDLKVIKGSGERGIEFRSKSFHSFRHTLNSILYNLDIADKWRMKILDHDSKAVNRGYSHADIAVLAEEMEKVTISI